MVVAETWYLYKEHYSGFWFTILRKDSSPPCGVLLRRREGQGVGRPYRAFQISVLIYYPPLKWWAIMYGHGYAICHATVI
jgi:hypothetical protein